MECLYASEVMRLSIGRQGPALIQLPDVFQGELIGSHHLFDACQVLSRVHNMGVEVRLHHPNLVAVLQKSHHVDGLRLFQRSRLQLGVGQEDISPEEDDVNLLE